MRTLRGKTARYPTDKSAANADLLRAISQLQQTAESRQSSCENNAKDVKKYQLSLAKDLIKVLFKELIENEEANKHKGLSTVEDKIDNALTILSYSLDKPNQLVEVMLTSSRQQEQFGQAQSTNGKSTHGMFVKGTS